jgi:hypothetical protein
MKPRASLTAFRVSLSGAGPDGEGPGGTDLEAQVGRPFREAAAEAFARALDEADALGAEAGEGPAAAPSEAEAHPLAFGRLPERLRAGLRRRVLREVVGPCAEQLLTATGHAGAPFSQSAPLSARA